MKDSFAADAATQWRVVEPTDETLGEHGGHDEAFVLAVDSKQRVLHQGKVLRRAPSSLRYGGVVVEKILAYGYTSRARPLLVDDVLDDDRGVSVDVGRLRWLVHVVVVDVHSTAADVLDIHLALPGLEFAQVGDHNVGRRESGSHPSSNSIPVGRGSLDKEPETCCRCPGRYESS